MKFVMCMKDMWVVQWYYIFEELVEMNLITKMMDVVSTRGCFLLDVGKRVYNSVDRKCLY